MDHHWLLYLYARERLHELAQQAADQRLRMEAKAVREVEARNGLPRPGWIQGWLKARRFLLAPRSKAINF